jgi:hypothetical protein
MALPKLETFTGADGTSLDSHDANWVNSVGFFLLKSNAARSAGLNDLNLAYWSGDVFNDAQSAVGTLTGTTDNAWLGVSVRCSGEDGYYFLANPTAGDSYFGTCTNGAASDIGGDRGTFSLSDTIGLEVDAGFNFTLKRNGSSIATPSDGSSTWQSGYPGLSSYYVSYAPLLIDDVTLDHVAAGGVAGPLVNSLPLRSLVNGGLVQ